MERLVCASCGALLPPQAAACRVCGWALERPDIKQLRAGITLMLLAFGIAVGIAVVVSCVGPS